MFSQEWDVYYLLFPLFTPCKTPIIQMCSILGWPSDFISCLPRSVTLGVFWVRFFLILSSNLSLKVSTSDITFLISESSFLFSECSLLKATYPFN